MWWGGVQHLHSWDKCANDHYLQEIKYSIREQKNHSNGKSFGLSLREVVAGINISGQMLFEDWGGRCWSCWGGRGLLFEGVGADVWGALTLPLITLSLQQLQGGHSSTNHVQLQLHIITPSVCFDSSTVLFFSHWFDCQWSILDLSSSSTLHPCLAAGKRRATAFKGHSNSTTTTTYTANSNTNAAATSTKCLKQNKGHYYYFVYRYYHFHYHYWCYFYYNDYNFILKTK